VNCFEVFGFDVLLDSTLRPWVLEVNASPSMAMDTELDRAIKPQLVRDTILLVNPMPFDRAYLSELLSRRARTSQWARRAPREREEIQRFVNSTMHQILLGQFPRLVGDVPALTGLYERLAPTQLSERLQKLKKSAVPKPVGSATDRENRMRRQQCVSLA